MKNQYKKSESHFFKTLLRRQVKKKVQGIKISYNTPIIEQKKS